LGLKRLTDTVFFINNYLFSLIIYKPERLILI
jgi:hypothetical protein